MVYAWASWGAASSAPTPNGKAAAAIAGGLKTAAMTAKASSKTPA